MTNRELENYFKTYYAPCCRIAFTQMKTKSDAEDVVQEVFLRLLKYQPGFESLDHEKAWMIRTTLNLCRDVLKSRWSSTIRMEELSLEDKDSFKNPYVDIDETLWSLLELPHMYRICLYLFYYEDYSIKEIAQALEEPENTIKTRLKRGREMLRKKLQEEKT
ncbi:MAG: sigma-70 family RNA polymerase sigma factor [Lachnospiraceae bacterium]|nr:sigma-70 family RNA polymerase sigma factor [Lachnospiraceae bacterium]MDE6982786.1 sigma-70 family RNA polymerase sigma factor [Lachnospiraceae bacterium]